MKNSNRTLSHRPPRASLYWTMFAICAYLVLQFGGGWLTDRTNIGPGEINALKALLVVITVITWFSWLIFFSRLRGRIPIALVLASLIALFFYFFQLRFDGDLGVVRVESRFLNRVFSSVETENNGNIDLSTTSRKDFSQFLGNQRNAVVRSRVLNGNWSSNPPKLLWKQPIGEGWSGFSAVNGFAVTQEQRGQEECVTCYDIATGELKWIYSTERRHEDTMSLGRAGPRATPTIHGGRVYVQGATGVLDCLDGSDGTMIWSVDLAKLLNIELIEKKTSLGFRYAFEDSSLAWGRSGSPLIYGDTVIVAGGGPRGGPFSTLIAFNKTTGKEIWRGGTAMIAYGSPAIAKLLNQPQVTIVGESSALGLDPDDGKLLWQTPREGASDGSANCSQVTPVSHDRILLSKGYQLGGELVELSQQNGRIETKTIWKNSRVLKTKMMSPVILDGYAYSLSDGYLECSDISDDANEGKRMWKKRGRFGNGQLLLVGDNLLVHTEFGLLKLIKVTPEKYSELGEIETIQGTCWNTICLYDNYLLVRSELEAACFELKSEVQTMAADDAVAAADEFQEEVAKEAETQDE